MRSLFTLAALGGFACGIYGFSKFMKAKRIGRWQQARLETWEGEGGALPAGAGRSGAQVRQEKTSRASPPGVN